MKFGRLLLLQSRDLDGWPLVQYKLLKKKIKARVTSEQQGSIFETGSFKRQIRDDMVPVCTIKLVYPGRLTSVRDPHHYKLNKVHSVPPWPQIKVNNFWAERQRELQAAEVSPDESSATEIKARDVLCRRLVRWLTLNYLAVLKVSGGYRRSSPEADLARTTS